MSDAISIITASNTILTTCVGEDMSVSGSAMLTANPSSSSGKNLLFPDCCLFAD
jgi:hypothetical protein